MIKGYNDCSKLVLVACVLACWGLTWAAVKFGAFIIYWFA